MKLFILLHERKYNHQTYLFSKSKHSDILIVVFSAFGGKYQIGGYNYVWTLKDVKANKLFIRDRFGYSSVGSYYLGEYHNLTFSHIDEIKSLIGMYGKGKKCVFCGTSKGGSAALYYGLCFHNSEIIIGSPQYFIGDYLNENDYHRMILRSICDTKDSVDILNGLLPNCIEENKDKANENVIYLMISSKEKSYQHHLLSLINQLTKSGYNVCVNDAKYDKHNDIAFHYPMYLKKLLGDILND